MPTTIRRTIYIVMAPIIGLIIGYCAVKAPALAFVVAGVAGYAVMTLYTTSKAESCRKSPNHASRPVVVEPLSEAPGGLAAEPARADMTAYATPDHPGPYIGTRRIRQPRTTARAICADNQAPTPGTM